MIVVGAGIAMHQQRAQAVGGNDVAERTDNRSVYAHTAWNRAPATPVNRHPVVAARFHLATQRRAAVPDPGRRRFLRWLPLRLLDVAALLCSLGVAGAITRWVLGAQGGRAVIRVTAPEATWLLRPDQDQVLEVTGPLGINRIVVRGGEVFVAAAPCANQICVKTGTVSRPGQWIACLPNRVFVAVEGGGDEQIDARSY